LKPIQESELKTMQRSMGASESERDWEGRREREGRANVDARVRTGHGDGRAKAVDGVDEGVLQVGELLQEEDAAAERDGKSGKPKRWGPMACDECSSSTSTKCNAIPRG